MVYLFMDLGVLLCFIKLKGGDAYEIQKNALYVKRHIKGCAIPHRKMEGLDLPIISKKEVNVNECIESRIVGKG